MERGWSLGARLQSYYLKNSTVNLNELGRGLKAAGENTS